MDFNLAFQNSNDPDPVIQLREMFDEWRAGLIGRPDGVQSIATLDSTTLPPDYVSTTTLTFELRDWRGDPISVPIESVDVEHKRFSAGVSRIGEVQDLGGGRYAVEITTGVCSGVDMFAVHVDDGVRPVEIAPAPTLTIAPSPESFQLADPAPGIAGQINTLVASNGQPGNSVRFAYGRTVGLTQTPCGPIAIADPVIAGEAIVDANGDASLARMVSQGARRQRYYFQAVDIDTCERTNVSCFRFE